MACVACVAQQFPAAKRRGSTSSEDEETDQVFCLRVVVMLSLQRPWARIVVP